MSAIRMHYTSIISINISDVNNYLFDCNVDIWGNISPISGSPSGYPTPQETPGIWSIEELGWLTYGTAGATARIYIANVGFNASGIVNTGDRERERSIVLPLYFRTA